MNKSGKDLDIHRSILQEKDLALYSVNYSVEIVVTTATEFEDLVIQFFECFGRYIPVLPQATRNDMVFRLLTKPILRVGIATLGTHAHSVLHFLKCWSAFYYSNKKAALGG
jgi:hypothetical protein